MKLPHESSDELENLISQAMQELSEPALDVYLMQRYPCTKDLTVLRLIDLYVSSTPEQRDRIAERLGSNHWSTLTVFAERMAVWAVRLQQPDLILKGLLALALDGGRFDEREDILIMAPLYHSAVKLGIDPKPLFLQAAEVAGLQLRDILHRFPDRPESNRNLASMGYVELTGPEGFTYRRTW